MISSKSLKLIYDKSEARFPQLGISDLCGNYSSSFLTRISSRPSITVSEFFYLSLPDLLNNSAMFSLLIVNLTTSATGEKGGRFSPA